jgi:tRNA(Ile)-lysidine synthase
MRPDALALLPRPAEAEHAPVLLALSGGLDSTVLLHRLACDPALRAGGLRALHIDHGLHPQSRAWAEQAAQACAALAVPFEAVAVDVPRDSGLGLEGAARQARRAVFAAALRTGETLALAQHRDDQAETFLLRALRASGPDGLAAMRPWSAFAAGGLWRPLLDTPRGALSAYAQRHGLCWSEDPSNADSALDRNFLHHRLLPLLRERWPHADAALARCAQLAAEASDLLADADDTALDDVRLNGGEALSRRALAALAPERRARVLRRWAHALDAPPLPAAGLLRIERELLPAPPDRLPAFAWSGYEIVAWRDGLYGMRMRNAYRQAALPSDTSLLWDGRTPLHLPNGDRLILTGAHALPWPVRAHARRGGERIRLPHRREHHTLKQVLQAQAVPPWERPRLPLLSRIDDGELVAVGDAIVSAEFDAWRRQHAAHLEWWRTDRDATTHGA